MKKKILNLLILTLLIFSLSTCNDPVFFGVFEEVAPLDPFIDGSPTKFAVIDSGSEQILCVASGKKLYKYDQTSPDGKKWTKTGNLISTGKIYSIAAIGLDLFIMYEEEGSSGNKLRKYTFDSNFEIDIDNNLDTTGYKIWSIYTANNVLFAGASSYNESKKKDEYCILHYDGTSLNKIMDTGNELLKGAAYDGSNYYYLITYDQVSSNTGSYYSSTDPSSITWDKPNVTHPFMGIITLPDNTVIAIERAVNTKNNSRLYSLDGSTVTSFASFPNTLPNGVLAIYEKDSKYLLLAGRQDSLTYTTTTGYTYGYLEMQLNSTDKTFYEPGGKNITTSVESGKNELFKSTIGKYPIEDIYQFKGTLFASTVRDGVWSYRNRYTKDGWHWNAETQKE